MRIDILIGVLIKTNYPYFRKKNCIFNMKNYLSILLILVTFISIGQTNSEKKEITVESIWKDYTFYGQGVSGFRSMNDGEHFTKFESAGKLKNIVKYNFTNSQGVGEILLSGKDITVDGTPLKISSYFFNADETKLLLTTEQEKIYRRSFSAVYYLYDFQSKKLTALDQEHKPQTLAEYSPDGKKVAYIHKNNIYVRDLEKNKIKQITKDGEINKTINGTTDWVYEEEFAITKGFEWSPDSKYIAYLKFDEAEVKEYTIKYYTALYPELYTFKYPKTGEDNSIVTAHIACAKTGKSKKINLGDYEYIPRLKWSATENKLMLLTLNRHQNHLKYNWVDATNKKYDNTIVYEELDKAYVEIDDNLIFLNDGTSFIRTSEKDGFNHIYKIGLDGSDTQITKGNWDVIEFKGINETSNTIYYTSAEEGAIYKGLYAIQLDGTNKRKLHQKKGYNNADFSTGMKYYINTWTNANSPEEITLHNSTGEQLEVLEDNEIFKIVLKQYDFQPKEFLTIEGHDGKPLNAWMIKPKNFDPNKKYPVYYNVYCGPGSNMVKDQFGGVNFAYHQLLAQAGYIVFSVDPRGTMYRGANFKKATYLKLGKLETEDLIASAKELQTLPYVDKERIGIMGWSYGGYMTSLAMTKGADIFKMGIAVAPVTNWRYYDNIYTERFMRTPQENPEGYDDNSPINHVDKLKGKYFLIHGSGDDNVHYQNSMEMINALVKADKDFDLFIYPNKNHGIYGGNTRNHLFRMMYEYTLENL